MSAGWKAIPLGELCRIEIGGTPPRSNSRFWDDKKTTGNVWVSIADMSKSLQTSIVDSAEHLSHEGAARVKVVKEGTLLVSFKLTLGRLAFAGVDLRTNEAIAALTPFDDQKVNRSYLYWYLTFFNWAKAAEGEDKVKGKTLNKAKLALLPVLVPSLAEQHSIVAFLDETFAGIAIAKVNAEKNLRNARELFDSARQALLISSGEALETSLGNEVELLVGYAFKSSGYVDTDESIRLLRGDNIVQGSIRWDGAKRWPTSDADNYVRFALREGDVVLAMDRPWVKAGLKRALLQAVDVPALLVQRTACLRAGARLDGRYLFQLISTNAFSQHLLAVQTGMGVPHISGQQIKDFSFALPPLVEQRRILDELEALQSQIQRLESLYSRKVAALDELKHSLLHQAFSGQLT